VKWQAKILGWNKEKRKEKREKRKEKREKKKREKKKKKRMIILKGVKVYFPFISFLVHFFKIMILAGTKFSQ